MHTPLFLRILALTICLAGFSAVRTSLAAAPLLSDDEKAAGWKLLFDGVSTTGWRGLGMDSFPADLWKIEDGCLHCLGRKKSNDLVTVNQYENFELSFEWMVPKLNGNSGVKYRVQEQKGHGFAFGVEYQCMYDPDATDKQASGSLYDVLPPVGKKLEPQGKFNQSRIIVKGDHIEHWLNGVKVVDCEFGSDDVNAAIAKSKFKGTDWGKKPLGHIVLQDHHDEVWFRNLKIRELPTKGSN
jgi:hypothetical protein